MKNVHQIDDLDKKLLTALLLDGNLSLTEMAKRYGVSGGTIHVRLAKLEQAGIIKNRSLEVDYTKLGYDISAFIGIFLEKSSMYDEVSKSLKSIPEVVQLHYITGSYNMLVKLICKDMTHLKRVLHDKMQLIKGIERTETMISLDETFKRPINLEIAE